jgi:hypothetical protein
VSFPRCTDGGAGATLHSRYGGVGRVSFAMRAAFVVLLVALFAVPAWAKGNGGGHGASGGHGTAGAHGQASHAAPGRGATSQNVQRGAALRAAGGFVVAPGANAPHTFANCPARFVDGAFCPVHGLHVGGSFFAVQRGFVAEDEVRVSEGTPDSDLGPWIIFLWLGRAVVGAARGLAAL